MRRGAPILPAALLLAAAWVRAEEPPAPADAAAVLRALHDGRFAAARAAIPKGSGRPEDLFLAAFTSYWNLIFDDENEALRRTMEAEVEAVLRVAEPAGKADPEPSAAVWGGTAHLVLAELRATERHPFGAAFEAKRAKKLLERATGAGADTTDALFGLGTYNYMADTVPAFVKGLRAILFLPGGDRERGLAQLEAAAGGSPHFAFEARVLLITIYANRHEQRYEQALEEASRLLAHEPDAVASLYAAARLDIALGRNDAALGLLDRADARARSLGDVDPIVLRSIDLLRARAEFSRLRPDLAAAAARRALASGAGLSDEIREDLEELRAAGERNAAGIDWGRVEAAWASPDDLAVLAGDGGAAAAGPLLALLTGDAYLRAGRAKEALAWLGRADAPALPPGLAGPRLLRQGQALDLLGDRPKAIASYHRAADLPGFAAKDAAACYQSTPFRNAP